MAAKPVILTDKAFKKKGDAEKYYLDKRQDVALAGKLTDTGDALFQELKEIYQRYCTLTHWPMKGDVIDGFSVGNTVRQNDNSWVTTKCYTVWFDNGENDEFSIPKALTAIANQ